MDDITTFDDNRDYDAEAKDASLERVEKQYVCVVCKQTKTWTVGEQEFMLRLKEQELIRRVACPKRCADCRATLKRSA